MNHNILCSFLFAFSQQEHSDFLFLTFFQIQVATAAGDVRLDGRAARPRAAADLAAHRALDRTRGRLAGSGCFFRRDVQNAIQDYGFIQSVTAEKEERARESVGKCLFLFWCPDKDAETSWHGDLVKEVATHAFGSSQCSVCIRLQRSAA